MVIRGGTVFLGESFREGMDVRLKHGLVTEIGRELAAGPYEAEVDAAGDYILPGFVDVHIHACKGADTMRGEENIRAMSRTLYRQGVAAFLPTTMSASLPDTRQAIEGAARVMEQPERDGAQVLGVHMEAPFLAPGKAGAQQTGYFLAPSMSAFLEACGDRPELVRLITVAPELPGAEAFIREAVQKGVHVSVGHTLATAEQTHLAADWGADHITHTFNAQTPLNHREPGVPGAAMSDNRFYAEMICDGVHLHRDTVRLLYLAKGPRRVLAVTDAMEAAGMPDGTYQLGGQEVIVRSGEARLSDGTLAGSVLTMPDALHNLIHRFDILPEDAVLMCTATPACSIGERLAGRITAGSPGLLTRWNQDWEMVGILDDRGDR